MHFLESLIFRVSYTEKIEMKYVDNKTTKSHPSEKDL